MLQAAEHGFDPPRKAPVPVVEHLFDHLADPTLFNFAGLALGGALPEEGGDTAFDREEFHDPQPDADDRPARPVISILDSRPKDSACG